MQIGFALAKEQVPLFSSDAGHLSQRDRLLILVVVAKLLKPRYHVDGFAVLDLPGQGRTYGISRLHSDIQCDLAELVEATFKRCAEPFFLILAAPGEACQDRQDRGALFRTPVIENSAEEINVLRKGCGHQLFSQEIGLEGLQTRIGLSGTAVEAF